MRVFGLVGGSGRLRRWPGAVGASGTSAAGRRVRPAAVSRLPAFRVTAGLPGGAKIAAVVLAQGVLLALADVRVLVDVRGVLDLILGHGEHDQLLAVEPGSVDRREALPGAQQAGLHENPHRLPGLLVAVHLGDLADPVALGVDSGAVDVLLSVLRGGHGGLSFVPDVAYTDAWLARLGTRHGELPGKDSRKQRPGTTVRRPGFGLRSLELRGDVRRRVTLPRLSLTATKRRMTSSVWTSCIEVG